MEHNTTTSYRIISEIMLIIITIFIRDEEGENMTKTKIEEEFLNSSTEHEII